VQPEAQLAPDTVAPNGPVPGGVATNATLQEAIDLREVNLIGVFGRPNDRRALVRLANGRYVRVGVGDSLDGGQVAAIGDNALNYVKRGQTITIAIPNG
jgi:Tfp pilus assembly protein PilP